LKEFQYKCINYLTENRSFREGMIGLNFLRYSSLVGSTLMLCFFKETLLIACRSI